MLPEVLTAAILTFLVTIVGVGTAVLRLLPGILERREQAFEARMKSQRKDEDAERSRKAKEIELQLEESRADTAILTAMSKNLEAATQALIAQTQYTEAFQQRFTANEKALVENTEALGQMAEHFGILLRTGSSPLQTLIKRIERIDEEGTRPLKRLQEGVDTMTNALDEVRTQVMPPGQIITTLTRIEHEIETLRNSLQAKINEAIEERRKTGPFKTINREAEP